MTTRHAASRTPESCAGAGGGGGQREDKRGGRADGERDDTKDYRPRVAKLSTLRYSPAVHPKTATFAKYTDYRELLVCVLCLSTGGRKERREEREDDDDDDDHDDDRSQ